MQLPFFTNTLFWVQGHNLGLKRPANFCKRVAFSALKVVKGIQILFK